MGVGGVESEDVRDFASGKAANALTSFGVPELHVTVVRGGKELSTGRIEGDIRNRLGVTVVGT